MNNISFIYTFRLFTLNKKNDFKCKKMNIQSQIIIEITLACKFSELSKPFRIM